MNSPELKINSPSRKDDTLDPRLKFVVSRKDKQLVSRHLSQKCLWHHRMSKVPGSEYVPYCPACEQIGNHGLVFTGLMWEVVTLVENDPVKREVMFSQLAKHLGHFAGFRNLDVKLKRVKPLWDKLRSSLNRMILTLKTDSAPVDGYFLQTSRFQRDYENLVLIKRGGNALVYRGTNKLDGNSYAFKVVPFRFKTRENYETIMREIQILASLDPHPNLIAYKTCWVEKWISAGKSSVFKTAKLALPPASQMNSMMNMTTTTADTSPDNSCWETTEASSTICSLTVTDPSPQVIIGSAEDMENIEVVTQIIKSEGHLVDDDFFLNNRVRTSSGGPESGDGFDFGASLYIQMELCGKSLKTWIKERNDRLLILASSGGKTKCLPEGNDLNECFNIFKQILIGVKVIHDNQVIHRDLKPENILFGLDGRIKIGDFGLSRKSDCKDVLDSPDSPTQPPDMDYTVGLGTSAYAAPEQLQKLFDQYDHKVDIFSIGMVSFELFHPFATNMEKSIAFDKLRYHNSLPPDFTASLPEVSKMILGMTSPLPSDRPDASKILVSKLFAQNGRSKMDDLRKEVAILKSQLLEKDEEIRMLREENRRLHVALLRCKKKAKYYVPILDKPNSHLARRITR